MLYAVNMKDTKAWLIDSDTMKLNRMSYEKLFSLYKSGVMLQNLVPYGRSIYTGQVLEFGNRKELSEYSGFIPRYLKKVSYDGYIGYGDKISLTLFNTMSKKHYCTILDDVVMVMNETKGLDIWYGGRVYTGVGEYALAWDDGRVLTEYVIGLYKNESGGVTVTRSRMLGFGGRYEIEYEEIPLEEYRCISGVSECSRALFLRRYLMD